MTQFSTSGRPPAGPRVLYGVAVGVAVVGVAVAALIYLTGHSPKAQPPAPTSSTHSGEPTAADVGPKSTCSAWQDLKHSLVSATNLPADWTYETPDIDSQFGSVSAMITKDLDVFKPRIAQQPADIAALAHAFVDKQAAQGPALLAHHFTPSDQSGIDAAAHALDAACGMQ
jgi:hypothetical protein